MSTETDEHLLAALLGSTRALILRAIHSCRGATTGRLAKTIGVSAATVSEHVKIMRNSGLLTSTRHAQNVLHIVTPLGRRLLDSRL
ncbi:ArsR/SmtB family transcription factor [Fodinicola feengrottensis]|uniref:ArsR/SmtB family transcription factor n=1 Tax=Fodinicola feengrottensis TaxID=435914 RepID=UPI0036F227F1